MSRPMSRPALFGAALALAASVVATVASPVAVAGTTTVPPAVPGSRFLALGDSVAFGYREASNLPTPDYTKPAGFRGYAEDVAAALGLRLTNAACPGETSMSFIRKSAPSNGCENHYVTGTGQVSGGYRTLFPLHTSYVRSQLGFAKHFLVNHPHTRLVTLTLGANDAFLCQSSNSDGCIGEFGDLLQTLKANIATILGGIRSTGYAGQIVLVNYYSLDYGNALLTGEVQLLNSALTEASAPYRVRIASGFEAFKAAAEQAGGDVCAAQLVTALSTGGCGVHPSVAGAAVLAQALAAKVRK